MFYRMSRLFDRFCAQRLWLAQPGPVLRLGGVQYGEVRQIIRRGNRLEVRGTAKAGKVLLHCGEETVAAIPRPDPADPARAGAFQLDLPYADGRLQLELVGTGMFGLPGFSKAQGKRARWRLLPSFAVGLLCAAPLVLMWALRHDPALRPKIRAALGLWVPPIARELTPAIFAVNTDTPIDRTQTVTCVMPVYNAFDLLPEVLARLEQNTDLPWHLIVIEDASPDHAVRPFLRNWAQRQNQARHARVTLLENDTNLGFIGSVNRGLALALPRGAPVILLNSDALVPQGWAGRLIRPLLADPAVASVTPMSNNAEIFSVPAICVAQTLRPSEADQIDAVAQGFASGAGDSVAPTGVGFCMALSVAWLGRVPQFDTGFGKGYGEEVDWCQKIRALGGRHLGLAGLFVEHRGGASFGTDQKRRLIAVNGAVISVRYPSYDIEVQGYLRTDPMITPRLALAIAWAAARANGAAVPIYLLHALGGGVEHYQRRRIAADIARQGAAVVLRVGNRLRWRLELHSAAGVTMGETDDFSLIKALLAPLNRRHICYACAVGDADPVTIPDVLLELAQSDGRHTVEVLFHDFFPISPSCNLLDKDGQYHGLPDPQTADPAHHAQRPNGRCVDLASWQAAWGRLIARADQVVVFSHSSHDIVTQVWPEATARTKVIPHQLHQQVAHITPQVGAKPVVAVLGNINRQKGSALLAKVAQLLITERSDLDLIVIGDTDPACPPGPHVKAHGEYTLEELDLLTRRYKVSAWLIPSVWPETFSYTTHEAIATGLPVFCLDLGAQAEAVRRAGAQGHVIACCPDLTDQAQAVLSALRKVLVGTA
jgi:O-antigen biosynthesis protein